MSNQFIAALVKLEVSPCHIPLETVTFCESTCTTRPTACRTFPTQIMHLFWCDSRNRAIGERRVRIQFPSLHWTTAGNMRMENMKKVIKLLVLHSKNLLGDPTAAFLQYTRELIHPLHNMENRWRNSSLLENVAVTILYKSTIAQVRYRLISLFDGPSFYLRLC